MALVGEHGAEIKAYGDQRVAALPPVAGDVLQGDARRLARELGQPGLVNLMSTSGLDADGVDVLQAGDQAQHGRRLGGLWHLPQPGQPVLSRVLPELHQAIQAAALFGRQALGQTVMHLATSLVAQVGA